MMGGDGGHHPHLVFEAPFNKVFVGALVGGGVTVGAGLIIASWKFQNKKQVRVTGDVAGCTPYFSPSSLISS